MPEEPSFGARQRQPASREQDQMLAAVAAKSGRSLRSRGDQAVEQWLEPLIADLDLESLKSFPASELAEAFPGLVDELARAIELPGDDAPQAETIEAVAALIASLRRRSPSLEKLIDDLARLKQVLLDAASRDLRRTDQAPIAMAGRLDTGFTRLLKAAVITHVENNSRQLQQLADTDPLTGLYNVRYFRRQLHKQLELYKRYRIPFSLLMIDLDNLKELNDTFGHEVGDRAIRNLADIMKAEKRETDIAVRYGGDEFFMILPSSDADEAERLAQRISRHSRALNFASGGREMTAASIGVAACPADGTDVGSLRARADRALYLAKTLGGGTVARYREFEVANM